MELYRRFIRTQHFRKYYQLVKKRNMKKVERAYLSMLSESQARLPSYSEVDLVDIYFRVKQVRTVLVRAFFSTTSFVSTRLVLNR